MEHHSWLCIISQAAFMCSIMFLSCMTNQVQGDATHTQSSVAGSHEMTYEPAGYAHVTVLHNQRAASSPTTLSLCSKEKPGCLQAMHRNTKCMLTSSSHGYSCQTLGAQRLHCSQLCVCVVMVCCWYRDQCVNALHHFVPTS